MATDTVVSLIAAMGKNREIGRNNKLLWSLPPDLTHFKELTRGRPVVMGRKTFDSIVAVRGKPLDSGRTNIVMTRDRTWSHEGAVAVYSIEEALSCARRHGEYIFVIGGEQVYREALPYANELCLTKIDASAQADAFFPEYESAFDISRISPKQIHGDIEFWWMDLKRCA